MSSVVVMGGRDFCLGFSLAGVETVPVDAITVHEAITEVLARADVALVILDDQFLEHWSAVRPLDGPTRLPLAIPVPGQLRWQDVERPGDDTYVATLIRQAVGYQLDIKL